MKLIKPSFSILDDTNYNIESIYKRIELVGRCSHKSEDRITEDSAKDFVGRMLNMKHLSTCEFGTVYLYIDYHNPSFGKIIDKYSSNEYSKCIVFPNEVCISSNYRVLVENNWLDDLKYLCEPTEYHHKRYTVKFILDRAILAEFTRHRRFSFMAESSRYNNYSKDKFSNELTFISPCWLNLPEGEVFYHDNVGYHVGANKSTIGESAGKYYIKDPKESSQFLCSLQRAEHSYLNLLEMGWKPEQARNVLPLCLKTELYMCGFAEDWEKFFTLRTASNAHPQSRELAIPLREEFIKRGYINE